MFKTQEECDRAFDALDKNKNGFISRDELAAFLATRRGATLLQAQQANTAPRGQTMTSPFSAPKTGEGEGRYGDVFDKTSEEMRSMKDTRRAFALAGPLLVCISAFIPCWNALALMRSQTYVYFAGDGSPLGGLLLFMALVVAFWMTCVMGVPCPALPLVNPFRWLRPLTQSMALIPVEGWIIMGLIAFLMFLWQVVPVLWISGIQGLVGWMGGIWHIFELMSFSTNPAATVVSTSVVAVVLYMLTLNYFFKRGKPEARGTVRSPFFIWAIFVVFMGVIFMFLSAPISAEAIKAKNEIINNCETSVRARDLFVASQALQALRQNPGCSTQVSVELCTGFVSTLYTSVLKSMEKDFKCSGFCYNPVLVVGFNTPQPEYNPTQAQAPVEYPPTLFSQGNYQASCDGMAARDMQFSVGVAGSQIFQQGVYLVMTGLFLAAIQMVSMLGQDPTENKAWSWFGASAEGGSYGTLQ